MLLCQRSALLLLSRRARGRARHMRLTKWRIRIRPVIWRGGLRVIREGFSLLMIRHLLMGR